MIPSRLTPDGDKDGLSSSVNISTTTCGSNYSCSKELHLTINFFMKNQQEKQERKYTVTSTSAKYLLQMQ